MTYILLQWWHACFSYAGQHAWPPMCGLDPHPAWEGWWVLRGRWLHAYVNVVWPHRTAPVVWVYSFPRAFAASWASAYSNGCMHASSVSTGCLMSCSTVSPSKVQGLVAIFFCIQNSEQMFQVPRSVPRNHRNFGWGLIFLHRSMVGPSICIAILIAVITTSASCLNLFRCKGA